jgi:hypothetical protein
MITRRLGAEAFAVLKRIEKSTAPLDTSSVVGGRLQFMDGPFWNFPNFRRSA